MPKRTEQNTQDKLIMSIFLDQSDVAILTGKKLKSQQVDVLRRMGIVFYVNASGHPVVPRSAIDGSNKFPSNIDVPWVPRVLSKHG